MLIEITLVQSSSTKAILLFDGRVLELFHTLWVGKTLRYHVANIGAIEIVTDKKGAQTLSVKGKAGGQEIFKVEAGALADAQQLVAAVQQAMAAYP